MKKEAQFEKDLRTTAIISGCRYYKIPDTKMLNQYNRYRNREEKRPFDGILVTPNGNFCIECKIDYNRLKPHQEQNQEHINKINKSFFVFRKIFLKSGVKYKIQQDSITLFETTKIEEMIEFMKRKDLLFDNEK